MSEARKAAERMQAASFRHVEPIHWSDTAVLKVAAIIDEAIASETERLRNTVSKQQRKITAQKELIDTCTDKIAAQRSSLRNRKSQAQRLIAELERLREQKGGE